VQKIEVFEILEEHNRNTHHSRFEECNSST
jgi:hypothetical protein